MLNVIAWYTPFIFTILFMLVSWWFGDWSKWQQYYSTILFIAGVSFFAWVLTYEYPMWLYHEALFLPNRTFQEFRLIFLLFPSLVMLYLPHFPYHSKKIRQITYILMWTAFWSIKELGIVYLGIITFHNGWHMGWSVLVWVIMLTVMAIHHKHPPVAWLICIVFSAFVIIYFNIPWKPSLY